MGAFKIQTDLDLSGFNLLNFCIQSYTDLENVPNLGLGRKLFFTGNSTDEKNLREVIWNGVEWKAAAYLDDIEALTNGEGSLGTRVKALEDMLGLQDVTDVIDTWNDVKAFFANVDEGLNLMTMLDGKLDKTGGTMTGGLTVPHLDVSSASGNAWIRFKSGGEEWGYIGFAAKGRPKLHDGEGWKDILHTGNFNYVARPLASGTWGIDISGGVVPKLVENGSDLNNLIGANHWGKVYYHDSSVEVTNAPLTSSGTGFKNGALIPIRTAGGYTAQLYVSSGNTLHLRTYANGNWSQYPWKKVAFTDSTVAAAKKLETAVSLWGNTFDGTQSVNDNIYMSNGDALYFVTTSNEYISCVNMASDNVLTLGNGTNYSTRTLNTRLDGYNIYFRTGAKQTAMTINSSGNVTIGGSDLASEDYKLYVDGLSGVHSLSSTTPSLGELPERGLVLFGWNNGYGMSQWIENNGNGCIQVGRFDGTATAYALNLNPLGGNVNIASADASTNVFGELKVGSGTMGYINLVGSGVNYLWAANTIHIGLSTVGGRSGDNATLTIKNNSIHSGFRNDAVSLGTSSYRWSDVYSVNGNFSNAVTVGSTIMGIRPTDGTYVRWKIVNSAGGLYIQAGTYDGNSANGILHLTGINNEVLANLNVRATLSSFSGLATFNGGALIPTGQTLTIGSVTFRETAEGEVEVDGNLHATGTLASGGKATVGEGDNGGGGNANVYSDVLEGVITQEWEVGNPFQKEDVIVSLYMWNTDESRWEMVLADIGVTSENIWVTFGRPTSTTDKYMAVVMG